MTTLNPKEMARQEKETKRMLLKRSIILYLFDYGESSLSNIMAGITTNYVNKESNNYMILFDVVRQDIKNALHSLRDDGYVSFVGGHKWKITDSGIEKSKEDSFI